MKNMMQKLKNKKKGFTLVEVIVVLVILAILAAIAIPALTGYISKAQEKAATSEARTVMVAVQTLASDQYVELPTEDALQITDATTSAKRDMTEAEVVTAVTALTGQSTVDFEDGKLPVLENGKVKSFTIVSGGWKVTYSDGNYTAEKA